MTNDPVLNNIYAVSDCITELEFRGLTPIECLLKILKENKKHREENEND